MQGRCSKYSLSGKLCLVVLSLCLVACRKITTENMSGRWTVKYSRSNLVLNLRRDCTYEQVFSSEIDGKELRRSGTWEIENLHGQRLVLHAPLIIEDDTGRIDEELSSSSGDWILDVSWTPSGYRMPVNEDLGLYFDRQAPD